MQKDKLNSCAVSYERRVLSMNSSAIWLPRLISDLQCMFKYIQILTIAVFHSLHYCTCVCIQKPRARINKFATGEYMSGADSMFHHEFIKFFYIKSGVFPGTLLDTGQYNDVMCSPLKLIELKKMADRYCGAS